MSLPDPEIATVTHLSNTANSIFLPPLSIYSRRPVMTLPNISDEEPGEKAKYADELDRHVHHVLKRRDKVRRVLRGFWKWFKTRKHFLVLSYRGFADARDSHWILHGSLQLPLRSVTLGRPARSQITTLFSKVFGVLRLSSSSPKSSISTTQISRTFGLRFHPRSPMVRSHNTCALEKFHLTTSLALFSATGIGETGWVYPEGPTDQH